MARSRLEAFSIAVLAVGACLSGTDLVSPPIVPPTTITLAFHADSEDLATAAALGWAGGIPGVTVTLAPEDSGTGAPVQLPGSDSGTVTLDSLAGGRYVVDAVRWLTDSERAQLPPGDDAVGFVARVELSTATAAARLPVRLVASRRRGIVISEWAFHAHGYQYGGFLALYNNADTTVYVDGIIIARGFELAYDYPNSPCSDYLSVTNDPTTIWTRFLQEFPGSGRDYPVAPGQTIVIATDAIDHRPLTQDGIDLRSANFEFTGPPDVDNPAVPNMVDVGVINLAHGLRWAPLAVVVAVALPANVATLPRGRPTPESATDWVRLPREIMVDVLWIRSNYAGSEYVECPRLVHSNFDRAGAAMRGTDEIVEVRFSVSRRVLPDLVNGRRVLQHTRTGNADFIRTLRHPGTVE